MHNQTYTTLHVQTVTILLGKSQVLFTSSHSHLVSVVGSPDTSAFCSINSRL